MANNCAFWGQVTGSRKDVEDFAKYFKTNYNYLTDDNGDYIDYPEHDHLTRVYYFSEDCYDGNDEECTLTFSGECAWALGTAFDHYDDNNYVPKIKVQETNSIINKALAKLGIINVKGIVFEDIRERRFVDFDTVVKRLNNIHGHIYSEERGLEFTEGVEFSNGSYTMECEDLTEIYLWFEDLYDSFEEFVDNLSDVEKSILYDVLGSDSLDSEEKFIEAREKSGEEYIIVSDAEWIQNDYSLVVSPKNYQTFE